MTSRLMGRVAMVAAAMLAMVATAVAQATGAGAVDAADARAELVRAQAGARSPADLARVAARPEVALAAARARLCDMVGDAALAECARDAEGTAFLQRVWNDQAALDAFTTQPPAPQDAAKSLAVWRAIDAFDPASRSGLLQRLAIAVALEHGVPVLPWSEWGDERAPRIDPVKRYAFYRDAHAAGTLLACFDSLPVWELRRVVDIPLYDEDVAWFHTSMPRPELRSQQAIGDAMWLVKYQERNPANGRSIHEGKPYYDGKRWTPAVILEYGGVCGAVAKFGSFAARAFGVPAQPIGQEGHCAMAWKRSDEGWVTGNCGPDAFAWSNLHGLWPGFTGRGSALVLYHRIGAKPELAASCHAAQLASQGMAPGAARRARLMDAIEACPANFGLWSQVVREAVADPGLEASEATRIATRCLAGLGADAPQMAIDLVVTLENGEAVASLDAASRLAWNDALLGALAKARAGQKAGNDEQGAWQELLARRLWLMAGEQRGFGDFPLLEHQAILNGKQKRVREWWDALSADARAAAADRLLYAGTRAAGSPALARAVADAVLARCMEDDALRARAARAVSAAGEALRRAGDDKAALALYRTAILEGERLGDRPWVVRFTREAKRKSGGV